jgi:multiple sugar transport system permease protein
MESIEKRPRIDFRYLLDREGVLGPLMIAPAVGYVILLVGFPFLFALYLSASNAISGGLNASFVGLKNFIAVVGSPIFRQSLANTFIFTFISQLLVLVLGKILALALVRSFPGKPLVRFLVLLPWAAPIVLGTLGWVWIFDSTFSVINWMLKSVGALGPYGWLYWLGDTWLGMIAIITVHVWRMLPFATVILLAGLTAIPQDIVDATTVDGAGFWLRLFEITIPLMLPIMVVAVLFGIVFTFTDMSVVYLLTRGGPFNSTHVLSSLAFQQGILGGDLGQGAAIAVFLFPLLVVVAVLMLRIARRTEVV